MLERRKQRLDRGYVSTRAVHKFLGGPPASKHVTARKEAELSPEELKEIEKNEEEKADDTPDIGYHLGLIRDEADVFQDEPSVSDFDDMSFDDLYEKVGYHFPMFINDDEDVASPQKLTPKVYENDPEEDEYYKQVGYHFPMFDPDDGNQPIFRKKPEHDIYIKQYVAKHNHHGNHGKKHSDEKSHEILKPFTAEPVTHSGKEEEKAVEVSPEVDWDCVVLVPPAIDESADVNAIEDEVGEKVSDIEYKKTEGNRNEYVKEMEELKELIDTPDDERSSEDSDHIRETLTAMSDDEITAAVAEIEDQVGDKMADIEYRKSEGEWDEYVEDMIELRDQLDLEQTEDKPKRKERPKQPKSDKTTIWIDIDKPKFQKKTKATYEQIKEATKGLNKYWEEYDKRYPPKKAKKYDLPINLSPPRKGQDTKDQIKMFPISYDELRTETAVPLKKYWDAFDKHVEEEEENLARIVDEEPKKEEKTDNKLEEMEESSPELEKYWDEFNKRESEGKNLGDPIQVEKKPKTEDKFRESTPELESYWKEFDERRANGENLGDKEKK